MTDLNNIDMDSLDILPANALSDIGSNMDLSYFNDNSLFSELGLGPLPEVPIDANDKIMDTQGKEFVTLQSSVLPFDDENPGQQNYNTFDTYEYQHSPETFNSAPSANPSLIVDAQQSTEAISEQQEVQGFLTASVEQPTLSVVGGPHISLPQSMTGPIFIVASDSCQIQEVESNTPATTAVSLLPPLQSQEIAPVPELTAQAVVIPSLTSTAETVVFPPVTSATPTAEAVVMTPLTSNATGTRRKSVKRCAIKPAPSASGTSISKDSGKKIQKPRAPRRRRPKKPKKYEQTVRCTDPVEEKKRLNAINAKQNRERKKNQMKELEDKVAAITQERDSLLEEVVGLRKREQELRNELIMKYNIHYPSP